MGELLQSGPSLAESFGIITGFAPKIFSGWSGAIILLNAERTLLEVAGGWSNCQISSMFFEPNSCWALRTGRRHVVEAGDRSAPCRHADAVAGGYVCVPLQTQGEAIGIIHLQVPEAAGTLVESEVSLIGTFAEQIGLSIANIRLREELRNQSIRDPLTGLFNRRYLEETLNREIHRVQRSGQTIGVLMLDLDHFKRFNDTFGHDGGDVVLRAVGSLFGSRVRTEDIACRYGGEEFVLVLPDANMEMTAQRAEELCTETRALKLAHNGKPLGQVTISVGAACFPVNGSSAKAVLAAADAALYQAKFGGRNRVVLAQGQDTPDLEGVLKAAQAHP
jgi:diguanylate cyclase (GGDEF)-like protein